MGDEKASGSGPKERTNISDAYTLFGLWGANMDSNPDWYKSSCEQLSSGKTSSIR